MKRLFVILSTLVLLCLVTTAHGAAKKKAAPQKGGGSAPPLKVHTYTSGQDTFEVNSYLLETRRGVILIDTQMTVSEAKQLKERLTKIGKPLSAIIVTHPHPDHYGNVGMFAALNPSAPVYATAATIKAMRRDDPELGAYWRATYGLANTAPMVLPTSEVKKGEVITIDNLQLQFDEVNDGESSNQMLIYLPVTRALFVGDLVFSGVFANTKSGMTRAWLANLQSVVAGYPDAVTVYPGHGKSGGRELLSAQEGYLTKMRSLIKSRINLKHPHLPFDGLARKYVRDTMSTTYKEYTSHLLMDLGLQSVVAELLQEAGYRPTSTEEEEEEE